MLQLPGDVAKESPVLEQVQSEGARKHAEHRKAAKGVHGVQAIRGRCGAELRVQEDSTTKKD
jgi:hypothetical protein